LATIDMGRKRGRGAVLCRFTRGGSGDPSNTMSPGPKPISVPSGILIHPTVWPQYTNVTDRQTGQRSRSIGRTVTCNCSSKNAKRESACNAMPRPRPRDTDDKSDDCYRPLCGPGCVVGPLCACVCVPARYVSNETTCARDIWRDDL